MSALLWKRVERDGLPLTGNLTVLGPSPQLPTFLFANQPKEPLLQ